MISWPWPWRDTFPNASHGFLPDVSYFDTSFLINARHLPPTTNHHHHNHYHYLILYWVFDHIDNVENRAHWNKIIWYFCLSIFLSLCLTSSYFISDHPGNRCSMDDFCVSVFFLTSSLIHLRVHLWFSYIKYYKSTISANKPSKYHSIGIFSVVGHFCLGHFHFLKLGPLGPTCVSKLFEARGLLLW